MARSVPDAFTALEDFARAGGHGRLRGRAMKVEKKVEEPSRRDTVTRSHPMLFAAAAFAMVAAAGACRKSEAPLDPKRAAFQEMNHKLDREAGVMANDDVSRAVADRVQRALTAEQRVPAEQLRIVVEKGSTEKLLPLVVVLIRIDQLKKESSGDRKMLLEKVVSAAAEGLEGDTQFVVGLRDAVFYGAIAQGGADDVLEEQVGATLDTAPLEEAIFSTKAAAVR